MEQKIQSLEFDSPIGSFLLKPDNTHTIHSFLFNWKLKNEIIFSNDIKLPYKTFDYSLSEKDIETLMFAIEKYNDMISEIISLKGKLN